MLWLYGYVASFVRDKTLISSALSGFVAQPCRLTTSFCANKSTYDVVEFSDKRGSKSLEIAHFCSALPCIVTCVAAQCRHAYSCNKIGRGLSISTFRIQPDFCVISGDRRTWSFSFLNRHTGLSCGLHGDIYGRKRRRLEWSWLLSFLCQIVITTSQQPRWMSLFP